MQKPYFHPADHQRSPFLHAVHARVCDTCKRHKLAVVDHSIQRLRHMFPHVEACHACVLNLTEPPDSANMFAVDRGLNKDNYIAPCHLRAAAGDALRGDLALTAAGN